MESLTLNIVPSPTSNDHQVRIQIDNQDWLGEHYLGIDPPRFFSQSALIKGGVARVGRCECGVEGCDDYIADVLIEKDFVTWKINKGFVLHFDRAAYMDLIKGAAKDFSWEDKNRTAERIVEEIFRDVQLGDGYLFDWASARIKPGKISVSFSKDGSQRIIDFDWFEDEPETARIAANQKKLELFQ
jgi:hypothetical protein